MAQIVRYIARLEVTLEIEVPIEDEENENNQGDESQNTEGE